MMEMKWIHGDVVSQRMVRRWTIKRKLATGFNFHEDPAIEQEFERLEGMAHLLLWGLKARELGCSKRKVTALLRGGVFGKRGEHQEEDIQMPFTHIDLLEETAQEPFEGPHLYRESEEDRLCENSQSVI